MNQEQERLNPPATLEVWKTVGRPGYLGKRKDATFAEWSAQYGEGNWRLVCEMASGEVWGYDKVLWNIYVAGYVAYFLKHPDEARFITENFSYAFDKDMISEEEAFDIYALYGKPGRPNQFHHVALNFALRYFLGMEFKGSVPLQVREGKPGTPDDQQPAGYRWSPGRIPAVRPDLIPQTGHESWWQPGSIEAAYQESKALQVSQTASG